ncbi:hypothetical protein [Rhizobium leguminosarum]|uniref:hypothetical protein n=1 Tax=Rhizobium leguminosarum TaxID=384 RepID=UPI003F9E2373
MRNAGNTEFSRDRALQWHMHADYDLMVQAGVPLPDGRTKRDRQALASIASGIISSARTKPEQWMSYSRSESWYPGQEMYYGDAFGYSTVVGAMEKLTDSPLIEGHIKARPGDHLRKTPTGVTHQSRILPAVAAAKIVLPKMNKELAQSIRLRRREDKRLVPYKETEAIYRMRNMLTKLNAHYAEADIEFHGGRRDGDAAFFVSKKGHEYGVDLSSRACHRVFNDIWTLGGRYYGAAWQAMDKDARKQIVIGGEEVFEADFATLHPRLLYRAAGLRFEGDAYNIPGYGDHRDACKRGVNILINAAAYEEAVHALSEHVDGGYHEAVDLIEAIREKHAPIARFFHSDAGIRLQRIDSSICTDILNELTLRQGVTCLSVHDSFIVPSSYKTAVLDAMERHYNKHVNGVSRVLNSYVKTKECHPNPLHNGSILPSAPPASCRADSSDSESNRNRRKIQSRNLKTIRVKETYSVVTNRFSRIKTRAKTAATVKVQPISAASSVVVEQEKRRKKPEGCSQTTHVRVDAANVLERTVYSSSDDCRQDKEVKERPKAIWQPRKTTVLELVRDEERRRDAKRNGNHTKTGRELDDEPHAL